MILTTDFRTHILPGIDDGSLSVTESVKMIEQERDQGITTIILTPHFYGQQMHPDVFLQNRQKALDLLMKGLKDVENPPRLIAGAEVSFCAGMSKWEQLDKLTVGNSKYIIIEMPFIRWSDSMYKELESIRKDRGLIPVIPHIERYLTRTFFSDQLKRLSKIPVFLQANCNLFNRITTRHIALKLLKQQHIHFLGSDCHGSRWRAPNIAQARKIILKKADKKTIVYLREMERFVFRTK